MAQDCWIAIDTAVPGPTGPAGPVGPMGSQWFLGQGLPASNPSGARPGIDKYLDTTTGNTYNITPDTP